MFIQIKPMESDNIYNQLKKLLEESGGKYNILEEQINIDLQVDFFELINNLSKEKGDESEFLHKEERLFSSEASDDEKKKILAEFSNTKDPKSYRIIQRFLDSEPGDLYQWAVLSLQHCRISLETDLLDEQQVFISTGLGGKGDKLRYFIVCKFKDDSVIKNSQKKVLQTEFEISFSEHHSDIERLSYFESYFSILGLIPIDISINEVVKLAIHESNNYGDFIHDKFLVTNVKVLKKEEIARHFKKMGI